jgi:universal stress protein F
MYQHILVAIDLNEETAWRKPLLTAVELARTFRAQLHVVTVVREVEAILETKASPIGYDVIVAYLETRLAALLRSVGADDLQPKTLVVRAASIYAAILAAAETEEADLIVVGSHRPAMKDYLLGTNSSRVVRHARCSVLVAR